MAALRWDQLTAGSTPFEANPAFRGPRTHHLAIAGDDDPARGIVLGVAASLIGFWLPLAVLIALRSGS